MEEFIKYVWPWGLAIASVLLALAVTIHSVPWKRVSWDVIGWVGLDWLAPILGDFVYFCLASTAWSAKRSLHKFRKLRS